MKIPAVALALVCTFGIAPAQQDRTKERVWVEKMGRGDGGLKPGDNAPDFNLKKLRSEVRMRLSDFRGVRPVALVFGSYT